MVSHVVVGGKVARDPQAVLDGFTPSLGTVPADVWRQIRPLAVSSVSKVGYTSAWTTHLAIRATAQFLTWALAQGLPLDAETVFTPDLVERFVASEGATRKAAANYRSALRTVARAATTRAPWPPPPPQYSDHKHLRPPYSQEEVAVFWAAARAQATEHRTRVMTAMLTLGLGAGLKVDEALSVTAVDHVRVHPDNTDLWVILLPSRTIPVRIECVPALRDLCRRYPSEPLMGRYKRDARDPLYNLRKSLEIPSTAPNLTMSRLRTTWMARTLEGDVRISEFMRMAGTVSSKTLECIAPWIPLRDQADIYLIKGAGL